MAWFDGASPTNPRHTQIAIALLAGALVAGCGTSVIPTRARVVTLVRPASKVLRRTADTSRAVRHHRVPESLIGDDIGLD